MSEIVYLVSPDTIKQLTELHENVEDKTIKRSIIRVQDIHIEPIIGTKLYNKLKTLVKDGTINNVGNEIYKTLLNTYLQPCMIEYTMSDLVDYIHYKLMAKGVMTREAENAIPAGESSLQKISRTYLNNAKSYVARMQRWLCDNEAQIPELTNISDNELPPTSENYKIGFEFP